MHFNPFKVSILPSVKQSWKGGGGGEDNNCLFHILSTSNEGYLPFARENGGFDT